MILKWLGPRRTYLLGWKLLRQGLHIEPEQRVGDKGAVYLGCRHVVSIIKLPNGQTATTMTYDMEDFLQSCIDKYTVVVGPKVSLRNYSTPFLAKDHRASSAGGPGSGPVRECPWCFFIQGLHLHSRNILLLTRFLFVAKPKTETSVGSAAGGDKSVSTDGKKDIDEGVLASVACSLLMKVLWVAVLLAPIYFKP